MQNLGHFCNRLVKRIIGSLAAGANFEIQIEKIDHDTPNGRRSIVRF